MNLNCFNPQYILVFIKYTEISNVSNFKLNYLLKNQYLKNGVPLTTIKIVQGGPKNGGSV